MVERCSFASELSAPKNTFVRHGRLQNGVPRNSASHKAGRRDSDYRHERLAAVSGCRIRMSMETRQYHVKNTLRNIFNQSSSSDVCNVLSLYLVSLIAHKSTAIFISYNMN